MSTSEVSQEDYTAITESVRPALNVVMECVEIAKIELDELIRTQKSLRALSMPAHVHQYISLGRFLLRQKLAEREEEMGSWRLNNKVTTNGAILLHRGLQHVRLLHHRDSKTTPHAGRNGARIDYFTNTAPALDPALLTSEQRLLLLWQIWDSSSARLIHTLSPGRFRRNPRIDLDARVVRDSENFEDLKFEGDLAQGLDLDNDVMWEGEATGTDDELP